MGTILGGGRFRWPLFPVCAALISFAFGTLGARAQSYTFTTIDVPASFNTKCNGISGDEIVGSSQAGIYGTPQCFVLQNGTFSTTDFGLAGVATGISGSNAIVYTQDEVSSPAVISYVVSVTGGLSFIQNILYNINYTAYALGIDGSTVVGTYGGPYNEGPIPGDFTFSGFTYNINTGGFNDLINPAIYPEAVVPTAISGDMIVGYYSNSFTPWSQGAQSGVQAFLHDGVDWTTFADPSAAAGTTTPAGIDGNLIAGNYLDAGGTNHGFTYNYVSNTWATIDDPAGSNTVVGGLSGTDLVGYFTGTDGASHGFYASLSGASSPSPTPVPTPTPTPSPTPDPYQFQSFSIPGSKSTACAGVFGNHIVGTYVDSKNIQHGFVLTGTSSYLTLNYPAPKKSGTTNTVISGIYDQKVFGSYYFNYYIPSAPNGPNAQPFIYDISQGTYTNLSTLGQGWSFAGIDGNNVIASSLSTEEPLGDYSVIFDVANDTTTNFTIPASAGLQFIDASAQSAVDASGSTYIGTYVDYFGATLGFLTSGTGDLPVEEPNSFNQPAIIPINGIIPAKGTQPASIDGLGTVVGNYWDASSVEHGFVYDTNNVWTTVDVPSATYTSAAAIYSGTVVGTYSGTDGVSDGFIATPAVSSSTTEPAPEATYTFEETTDAIDLSGLVTNGPGKKLDPATLLQFFNQPNVQAADTRLYFDRIHGVVVLGSTARSTIVSPKPRAPLVIYGEVFRFGPQTIGTARRDGDIQVSGSCSMIDNQYPGTFTGWARNPATYKGDNLTVTIPGSPGITAHLVDYP